MSQPHASRLDVGASTCEELIKTYLPCHLGIERSPFPFGGNGTNTKARATAGARWELASWGFSLLPPTAHFAALSSRSLTVDAVIFEFLEQTKPQR